jgi:molecular chaperone GrpE
MMNQPYHSTDRNRNPHPHADDAHPNDVVFSEVAGAGSDVDADSPEQMVDALEQQVAELRDRELKAQAELENFRRRMLRDVETQLKFGSLPFVRDLLDVVDNLHRATETNSGNAGAEGLVAGVKLVQHQLASVLAKHHCTPIESVGKPFDPNVHQAIAQQPSQEFPAGSVMLETSAGYMMHDRVIRPSMVIVSTGPS